MRFLLLTEVLLALAYRVISNYTYDEDTYDYVYLCPDGETEVMCKEFDEYNEGCSAKCQGPTDFVFEEITVLCKDGSSRTCNNGKDGCERYGSVCDDYCSDVFIHQCDDEEDTELICDRCKETEDECAAKCPDDPVGELIWVFCSNNKIKPCYEGTEGCH